MTSPAPEATVVIVNYNGAHLLPRCLDALAAQRADAPPFDTVVVDNASTDGSLELLERDYPWARVVASKRNLGFAGGNNLALKDVSTPFTVLLNNDARPEQHWLRNLLAEFTHEDSTNVGIVNGKVVFEPRFLELDLRTPSFRPDSSDTRELGVRVRAVTVDGRDVTDKVIWGDAAYGVEGDGAERFRWTRAEGTALVPVLDSAEDERLPASTAVELTVVAETAKPLRLAAGGAEETGTVTTEATSVRLDVPAGTPTLNVINNAGGIVLADGSGADRGFHEVDRGQYDSPADVFTGCGNGMAVRTVLGHEFGWFDDSYFMYYEDTDLSWRWRSRGWTVRYVPDAVLRHIHAASSKEWSPAWRLNVERNRLLTLTKNASTELAARAVFGYVRTAGGDLARAVAEGRRERRRPAVRPHLLRARIVSSYARRAPRALLERHRLHRTATVDRPTLEQMLVTTR